MKSANATNSASRPSSTSQASLRPRNRRLISGLDEELEPPAASGARNRSASPFASPFGSRPVSPIPSTIPSRSNSSRAIPRSDPSGNNGRIPKDERTKDGSRQPSSSSIAGLWGTSWTALQEIASTVLGNDIAPQDKPTRRRRPAEATRKRTSISAPPAQWGPSGPSDSRIGAGSREEREDTVRAMKRKDLMNANGHVYPDAVGNFKRRNSDERISSSAPPADQDDRDALVYVVPVKPQDTLAGITIKFSCQPAVFRKANRMWPNDTILARRVIVLPVDACGVKGRPVAGPNEQEELLLEESDSTKTPTSSTANGWHTHESTSDNSPHPPPPSSHSSHADSEPPWKHDSWVLLPGDTVPTEIARLPRRTLGYFPPARRKSVSFSDNATPTTSLDLPRSSTSTLQSSPGPSHKRMPSITISNADRRRSRTASISSTFPLHGPGGVGTLGKNVRSPGPAQDGLNKLFGPHLPNVAPPPEQSYFTPWNPGLLDIDADGLSTAGICTGASTPGATAYARSAGLGSGFDIEFDKVGGAIEKWARKVASKASTLLAETSTSSLSAAAAAAKGDVAGNQPVGVVGSGIGDLIELRDGAFEAPSEAERAAAESRGWKARDEQAENRAQQSASARPDAPSGMRERERGRKGGKGD